MGERPEEFLARKAHENVETYLKEYVPYGDIKRDAFGELDYQAQYDAMAKARLEQVTQHYIKKLEARGYIVIPPSARKTRYIGPFVIKTDPIGMSIGWRQR